LLFLKQIGISIKFVEKKDVIVDWRKNRKVEIVTEFCKGSASTLRDVDKKVLVNKGVFTSNVLKFNP